MTSPEWLDSNDMVHFVIDTVESMELPQLVVNHRCTGTPQYPPQMMLALLYCYPNGIMSSRKIETATWHLIPVRYLTGDTHPDHDTINSFRKNNDAAIRGIFRQLLPVARKMKMLKVGTVSIDGTHITANASKYKNIRYDRIDDLTTQLDEDPPKPGKKRKSRRDGWQQADNWELEPALETVSPEVGAPTTVLADAGYVRKQLIERFDSDPEAPELYRAITGDDHGLRRYDCRPPKKEIRRW